MSDPGAPDGPAAPPRTVAIQVVLFDNDPAQQLRLAEALGATVRSARAVHDLDRVVVRYGDASRWPCLSDEQIAALGDAMGAGDDAGVDSGVDDVTYTSFGANLGSAGGSNALAALGTEDALWVLNPDTYPAPTALAELVSVLAAPHVGAAEARQLPIEHQKYYDPVTAETGWVSGACTLFRRSAFDAVDGFDARFFPLYCDDVDLSWRLRLAGWSIHHAPSAVVFHDKPISPGGAVRWTDTAARSSHLARLWLYRRYGRRDLEEQLVAAAHASDDRLLRSAVDEFERRVAAGDEPDERPDADAVAQFVDGQYAPRRFGYAV